ncbi:AraC family transcriptional regulator [Paenibacillus silagei]|uniref:Iron complex transport system substrate-binding protein n=1 Tax=Paenibacillus silagei TaxID=1670801 RepID=A0ABS4P3E4_9BACL|nr:AraC family transcriptional regulator [Paenibacillus silagei]MBP2116230.1 iron complex transport system substrate-binding protein [Paenibacillus silagei]
MDFKDHIVLWNHAAVEVIDIRKASFISGQPPLKYRLPASTYLYIVRGSASLLIDDSRYEISGATVFHGGKGTTIKLLKTHEILDYYLIMYRSTLTLPARRNLTVLLERSKPFTASYHCTPAHPLPLYEILDQMYGEWQTGRDLEHLHVKALFYQWVHELLHQMQGQELHPLRADVLDQAVRYMHDSYSRPFTLDTLADTLGTSPRTLSRLFRMRLQSSPAQYLVQIRMDKARELLLGTEATLHDIAAAVGYPDAYSFGKMFKKHFGNSPVRYKNSVQAASPWRDMISALSANDIAREGTLGYIDDDNHYQYDLKGASSMFRTSKPSLMLTLLLCFTIVLSACSSGNATTTTAGNGSNTPTSSPAATASSTTSPDNTAAEAQIRTISTIKGDIEVPANPQRVVVLYLLGDVLALGIKPVGVSSVNEGAAFENELKDVQKLGSWFEASPEAVLSLDPDLIIVPSEETYNALHDIAPTVLVPYEKMTTAERVSFIGHTLNKEDQATSLLNDFNAKVEDSKLKLKEAGILDSTISIMEGGGERSMLVIMSKQYGRGSQVLYEYLGMKAPEKIQQKIDSKTDVGGESVSFEVITDYSGDYIFRSSYDGMTDLTGDPIWNSIPAVKEGRLMNIDFGLSYYNDIYSLNAQLDYMVDALLAAPRVK